MKKGYGILSVVLFTLLVIIGVSFFRTNNNFNDVLWERQRQVDSLNVAIQDQIEIVDDLQLEVELVLSQRDSAIAEAGRYAAEAKEAEQKAQEVIDSVSNMTVEELQAYYDVNYPKQDSTVAVALDSSQAMSAAVDIEQGRAFEKKSSLQSMEIERLYAVLSDDLGVILTQKEIIHRQDSIIRAYAALVEIGDSELLRARDQIRKEKIKTKIVGAGGGLLILTLLIAL
jgi:hypothetical protein